MKSDYIRHFFRISTIIFCMLAFSACEDIVDEGSRQVAVYMEVYDSDGNNLLDESNDNNIVGTTIKYVRKDQGSTYRVSWTGKEDNWSSGYNSVLWGQVLYIKDLNSLKLYDTDCIADFKCSYKLMFGEPEQEYDISIRHIGKKNKTEATVNGKKVHVSENNEPFINNCRYDYNHTFRLILPAKH